MQRALTNAETKERTPWFKAVCASATLNKGIRCSKQAGMKELCHKADMQCILCTLGETPEESLCQESEASHAKVSEKIIVFEIYNVYYDY